MNGSRWSIRGRLTVWNTVVLTVLFGIVCLAMLSAIHGHLSYIADQSTVEELQELVEELRTIDDDQTLVTQLTPRYSVHSHYHFQIVNSHGHTLFRSRFLSLVQLPQPESVAEFRGTQFENVDLGPLGMFRLVSTAVRNSRSEPLLLQVITPRAALKQEFGWYVGTLLWAFPLAVLLSLVTGYLLARQALLPLERMAKAAERISAEKLDERLAVTNPNDELGRLARTLNQMFDRIRTSVDQIRQFTADAAHELRSPIAALRARSEIALRMPRSTDEYQSVVQETLDETNRMSALVDQLLMLSRHDSGQPSVRFDELPVDQLLLDVIDRFRSVAEERQQDLRIGPLPAWTISGDDIWLSQLFWNLLDNAGKYTPNGETIEITAQIVGGQWCCSIRDSGVGIAAEHLPRIFDRFYRVDNSRTRSTGGTGLGLTICQSIVQTHGGTITATSQENVGSTFTVSLPGHPSTHEITPSEDDHTSPQAAREA